MNKTTILSLTNLLLLFSGCATSQESIPEKESNIFEYTNTYQEIGDKNNYINKVSYISKRENIIENKLTFYIDKFPFKKTFYLCSKDEMLKIIKKRDTDIKYLKGNKLGCKSTFYVDKNNHLKASYYITRDFNFLTKFSYEKDQNMVLKNTSIDKDPGSYFIKGETELNSVFELVKGKLKQTSKTYLVIE